MFYCEKQRKPLILLEVSNHLLLAAGDPSVKHEGEAPRQQVESVNGVGLMSKKHLIITMI